MAPNAFGIEHSPVAKRDYSTKTRAKLAAKGDANPDGSFPIRTKKDLENAKRMAHLSKHPEQTEETIERAEDRLGVSKAFTPVGKAHFEATDRAERKAIRRSPGYYAGAAISGVGGGLAGHAAARHLNEGKRLTKPFQIKRLGMKVPKGRIPSKTGALLGAGIAAGLGGSAVTDVSMHRAMNRARVAQGKKPRNALGLVPGPRPKKVAKAFTPVAKFGGLGAAMKGIGLIDDAAALGKGAMKLAPKVGPAAMSGTAKLGGKIASAGTGLTESAIKAPKAGMGTALGTGTGLGMRRAGAAIQANPGAALGTAGAVGAVGGIGVAAGAHRRVR